MFLDIYSIFSQFQHNLVVIGPPIERFFRFVISKTYFDVKIDKTISKPLILRSPHCPQCTAFPSSALRQWSRWLHLNCELQSIVHGSFRLKICVCWERGKSNADLFCLTLSSNLMIKNVCLSMGRKLSKQPFLKMIPTPCTLSNNVNILWWENSQFTVLQPHGILSREKRKTEGNARPTHAKCLPGLLVFFCKPWHENYSIDIEIINDSRQVNCNDRRLVLA
jgi:hypothetical protein